MALKADHNKLNDYAKMQKILPMNCGVRWRLKLYLKIINFITYILFYVYILWLLLFFI